MVSAFYAFPEALIFASKTRRKIKIKLPQGFEDLNPYDILEVVFPVIIRPRIKLPVFYPAIEKDTIIRHCVRDEYIRLQQGMCPLCGGPLDEPSRLSHVKVVPKSSLYLHHDHETGMTVCVLHASCNSMEAYDSKGVLLKKKHDSE
jgi:hypothetical protein